MGLLFSTEESLGLINMVNTEFSANIGAWKGRYGDFNGHLDLGQIASKWGVEPADPGRWRHWLLKVLHATRCPADMRYDPAVPSATQYAAPKGDEHSTVGRELVRLLHQALTDDNCMEIVVAIQPRTSVYIPQVQTIPHTDGAANHYTLAITICTVAGPSDTPGT